jgi:hypothetical protein
MEKTVEVELRDGTKKDVVMYPMSGLERLDLQDMVTPDKFRPNMDDFEIEKSKWKEYRKQMIMLSVKEPVACRLEKFLGEITGPSLEKLFKAAQEVNEETPQLAANAEKK